MYLSPPVFFHMYNVCDYDMIMAMDVSIQQIDLSSSLLLLYERTLKLPSLSLFMAIL